MATSQTANMSVGAANQAQGLDPSGNTINPTDPNNDAMNNVLNNVDSNNAYAAGIQTPPTTIDAGSVQNNIASGSSFNFPKENTTSNAVSNNLSVPNPIPGAQDIINQGNQQTPAESQNQSLLQRVASLVGGKQSQTGLEIGAEQGAGVPGLAKTVNDLTTQIQGLSDQATALANQSQYTIPNQEQINAQGRGITAGGLAPIQASDLRINQIRQGQIATQALTLKSALYAAQGNLALAKDAADKAAKAQYEQQQNQIDYMNALIEANKPQLTKEEKNQALLIQTQLADRQKQIDQAIEDKKTIVGLAAAAMKNNPNDPAAQYAAQQALAESNQSQPNLQKAFDLIGKYQQDPIATQQAIENLRKTRLENQALQPGGSSGLAGMNDPTVQGWVSAIKGGSAKLSDITAADLKKNPNLKNEVVNAMAASGSSQKDMANIAQQAVTDLQKMVDENHGFTGAVGFRGLIGTFTGPIAGTESADFAAKAAQTMNDVVLPNLTILHGLGRVTDREFQALQSSITSLNINTDKSSRFYGTSPLSEDEFKKQLENVKKIVDAKVKDLGADTSSSGGKRGKLADGTVVTQNADGSITDAKGNKYDANGNKIK